MKQILILVVIFCVLFSLTCPAWPHNPFTSKPENQHPAPEPPFKSQLFVKIIEWQHTLRMQMSQLIRISESKGNIIPLLLLMGFAFAYGLLHAAGPGHGKIIATSYVLTHNTSIPTGLLFGLCIAILHGFSGAIGVIGLHYIIQKSVTETLATATSVTQIISFGLITLLGLGILIKNGYGFLSQSAHQNKEETQKISRKSLLPWIAAVGLVPCPAVVMVMLFCLSMDVLILGLVLAACISLGMAATISFVVTAAIIGKSGILHAVPKNRTQIIEKIVGILSGAVIMAFGMLFLFAAINTAFY